MSPKNTVKTTARIIRISLESNCLVVVTRFEEKEITTAFNGNPQKCNVPKAQKNWETTDTYPLRKVSAEELYQLRLSKVSGIVYKDGNNLFYSEVPGTLRLNSSASDFVPHACGRNCLMVCNGCPRTSDLTVSFQERCTNNFHVAVHKSWRLEKYPFIVNGIEAFNMEGSNDACIVFYCKNYGIRVKPNGKVKDIYKAKLELAHFFWEDFDGNYEKMKARIRKNGHTGYYT